jgi:uncharacterized protein YecE (DUF72 family)
MTGQIRIGVGGWTFAPWRGVFYPAGLSQKRELEHASRQLTSIEINGTYYSTFKPDSFAKWAAETPDDFVFAVKASRFCTNRKVLAEAGPAIAKFLGQGLTELGDKLGPINWQFMATKKFDPVDFEGFLKLLPSELGGRPLRHALEVRHESFHDPAFADLAKRYGVAVVRARGGGFPEIAVESGGFTYARIMAAREEEPNGYPDAELDAWAETAKAWRARGDVFLYFISAAKLRNPAAAQALIGRV